MKPPRFAKRLLSLFLRDDLEEEVAGDLEEDFYVLARVSPLRAKLNYWYQVIHYLRPFALRKSRPSTINYSTMVRHNMIISFRNFKRYKSSFLINLIGLSTGLACTFLIYLWVSDEVSVDKFLDHEGRLFRVMEHRVRGTGIWTSPTTPGPMAEALASDMPEVEYAIPTTWSMSYLLSLGEKNIKADGKFAGKDFFKALPYEFISGDRGSVLNDKNAIVISDLLAMKLFNTTENLIGKMIDYQHESQLQVTGVFKAMPVNASDQFEFVGSFEKYREGQDWLLSWGNTGTSTLVLLKAGTNVDAFNAKIADYVKVKTNGEINYRHPFLKGYAENYLYGNFDNNGNVDGGRITYVKLFSVIAVFILLIACINFMNLSTARASRRTKEVGIKKVFGARRNTLVIQYLGESMIMSSLSMLIAILLVYLLLGQFNSITGKHLVFDLNPDRILTFAGITIFAGLMAGSYPALFLSAFRPAKVLKGQISSSISELIARKGLVVFQFAISILFIVCVLVVYKQIEFVQSTSLGYNKDNLMYFGIQGALGEKNARETMIAEVKRIQGVEGVSSVNHSMTGHNGGTHGVIWEGKDPEDKTEFERMMVNYDMIEVFGMEMAEGRSFSRAFGTDSSAIIFNQKGIDFMGMKNPIGKVVKLWGEDHHIIGVVKDFHYESLHENFKPLFMVLRPDDTYRIMARISAGNEKAVVAAVQALHQKLNPGFPFEYHFMDASYQSQYDSEQRVSVLSKYFAGLAILISCLGLFGLAAFTAERRVKEIGIRKVLGSSELGIIYLLSRDFTRIVLIAIVVALPLSYFAARYWLSTYAFKTVLQPWYFISAGILALAIAWLTVGLQAIRAARANPTLCLKNE